MDWARITPELVEEIVKIVGEKKILEVFSGKGTLARKLVEKGVAVHPTSVITSTYDGHEPDVWERVEIIDAVSACKKYKNDFDFLLASWAIADDTLLHCALVFDKPIIYIGQLWHEHPLNIHKSYSGTASDSYFENVEEIRPTILNASPNSVISLHQLKSELKKDFTPSLLMYEWADRRDLIRRYEQRLLTRTSSL